MGDGWTEIAIGGPGVGTVGRFLPCEGAVGAVVFVGGVGGGWDSPADGLYPRLAEGLRTEGLASLRVRFSRPGELGLCTREVRDGVGWLAAHGLGRVGLVGHSFGAAVVLRAAAEEPDVRAVVALSPQRHGADHAVATLGPRCAVLFVHGTRDTVLPSSCATALHARAHEPRRLVLHEGAGHGLDEVADAVRADVRAWLVAWLGAGAELAGPAPGIPKGDAREPG